MPTLGANIIGASKMQNNFWYLIKMLNLSILWFSHRKGDKVNKQRRLKAITLQGAIEKSPILLSKYWKIDPFDRVLQNVTNYWATNNVLADCN